MGQYDRWHFLYLLSTIKMAIGYNNTSYSLGFPSPQSLYIAGLGNLHGVGPCIFAWVFST